jgi:hypothetical protein
MLSKVWLLASIAIALAALLLGVWCLVRYARTRRRPFLVMGLVLTVGLGLVLLLVLAVGALSISIVYAPPPPATHIAPSPVSTSIIYAPPPTLNP